MPTPTNASARWLPRLGLFSAAFGILYLLVYVAWRYTDAPEAVVLIAPLVVVATLVWSGAGITWYCTACQRRVFGVHCRSCGRRQWTRTDLRYHLVLFVLLVPVGAGLVQFFLFGLLSPVLELLVERSYLTPPPASSLFVAPVGSVVYTIVTMPPAFLAAVGIDGLRAGLPWIVPAGD
ncbi:hypothetical protein L593_04775 [Salinarchaeum sp. Harcht-Bsk1]|uniref:hypothetical protein n=1 Tax=Salinarchaeum sp. Harcht-Bsk1 TaxID=1333523 RepID=UPI0003423B1F|nr:hypothetical protein [Salinarchaeum sp. Harcht-Bsk1]AGN00904.1 hypothetical protein L593_04775 [Salinarchaeum sp. Harcht-Bsk1]